MDNSPAIIQNVRFKPIVIPNIIERVIHILSVAETKKKVGMKIASIESLVKPQA